MRTFLKQKMFLAKPGLFMDLELRLLVHDCELVMDLELR